MLSLRIFYFLKDDVDNAHPDSVIFLSPTIIGCIFGVVLKSAV